MKYTDKHKVLSQFTDAQGNLRAGAILRYMQEAAANAMAADGMSYDALAAQGRVFVISKITLSIYSDIHANEEIEVETWATESARASFNRAYRVVRGGSVVAEAVSVWALVDVQRKRLVTVADAALPYREDAPLDLELPARIPIQSDSLVLVDERRVRYSDIDRNRHMNNTVYADMLCDYVFRTGAGRISKMSISYINEAPLGCELKVYFCADDDTYYIRTVREDGKINCEAEIILA